MHNLEQVLRLDLWLAFVLNCAPQTSHVPVTFSDLFLLASFPIHALEHTLYTNALDGVTLCDFPHTEHVTIDGMISVQCFQMRHLRALYLKFLLIAQVQLEQQVKLLAVQSCRSG